MFLLPWFDEVPNTLNDILIIKFGWKSVAQLEVEWFWGFYLFPNTQYFCRTGLERAGKGLTRKQKWLLLFIISKCLTWENLLDDSHPRWYTRPRHAMNSQMSAVRLHAPRNVFCVISAHLGLNRSVVHLQRARCCSSESVQKLVRIWHRQLAFFGQQS